MAVDPTPEDFVRFMQEDDGSFKQEVRSERLDPNQTEARIGIKHANRYYWHVSSLPVDGEEEYGPTSSFVILNTLSQQEAIRYTKRTIADRIRGGYGLKRLRCRSRSKVLAHCSWALVAGEFRVEGDGDTFLSRQVPDNLRYYHYDYRVEAVNEECVADHKRKREKCTSVVRWHV